MSEKFTCWPVCHKTKMLQMLTPGAHSVGCPIASHCPSAGKHRLVVAHPLTLYLHCACKPTQCLIEILCLLRVKMVASIGLTFTW